MAVHSLEVKVWSDKDITQVIDELDILLQKSNFNQIEIVDSFTYDDIDE